MHIQFTCDTFCNTQMRGYYCNIAIAKTAERKKNMWNNSLKLAFCVEYIGRMGIHSYLHIFTVWLSYCLFYIWCVCVCFCVVLCSFSSSIPFVLILFVCAKHRVRRLSKVNQTNNLAVCNSAKLNGVDLTGWLCVLPVWPRLYLKVLFIPKWNSAVVFLWASELCWWVATFFPLPFQWTFKYVSMNNLLKQLILFLSWRVFSAFAQPSG